LWFLRDAVDDWAILGNIGQAYGGISAAVSSLALFGIGISLVVQLRQHRLEQLATIRAMQFDIYDLVREDPATYGPIVGFEVGSPSDIRRRTLYVQFFQYVAASFEVGLIDEKNLRAEVFPGVYTYDSGRAYWRDVRHLWIADRLSSRRARFIEVADEELMRARLKPAVKVPSVSFPGRAKRSPASSSRLAWGLVGLLAGALAMDRFAQRRQRDG
jgi:hypothetical protein